MMTDLALVPAGAVRLADGFSQWWEIVRPGDDELLERRETELAAAVAEAREAEDFRRATAATEALDALRQATPDRRQHFAGIAELTERELGKAAFVRCLAAGALRARVLVDGREMEIAPMAWLSMPFSIAAAHRPSIYFAESQFTAWLTGSERVEAAPRFDALVEFLGQRLPPAPVPAPSESDDLMACRKRFGPKISETLIRDARRTAYGDRYPRRGNPRRSKFSG